MTFSATAPAGAETTNTADIPADIRLVMIDIDGTLSGQSNEVDPIVVAAIDKALQQGIKVGIATGRMYRSALRFHQTIGANVPLCSYQGALIKDPDHPEQQVYRHWAIPQNLAMELINAFAQHPLIVHAYIEDELYVQELNPLSVAYAERSQVPIRVLDGSLRADPTKVLAMSEDTDLILELQRVMRQQFPADQLYLTRSVPTFLEATHPVVNKGTAVKYLAEEVFGLQPHQVMTIGDSDNDIEMLAYAGIGVAMANATAEIQAQANWVAPSVDQHGVAAALEEFVLRA